MTMAYLAKRTVPSLSLILALAIVAAPASSQAQEHARQPSASVSQHVEDQRAPMGYARVARPDGLDTRPQNVDRPTYNHNFRAGKNFRIGPYKSPPGWKYNRYAYGQILPNAYWAQQYWLSDYWLFALDLPPVGCEWVRYGPDAMLVNIHSGEIIQIVYDLFY